MYGTFVLLCTHELSTTACWRTKYKFGAVLNRCRQARGELSIMVLEGSGGGDGVHPGVMMVDHAEDPGCQQKKVYTSLSLNDQSHLH